MYISKGPLFLKVFDSAGYFDWFLVPTSCPPAPSFCFIFCEWRCFRWLEEVILQGLRVSFISFSLYFGEEKGEVWASVQGRSRCTIPCVVTAAVWCSGALREGAQIGRGWRGRMERGWMCISAWAVTLPSHCSPCWDLQGCKMPCQHLFLLFCY